MIVSITYHHTAYDRNADTCLLFYFGGFFLVFFWGGVVCFSKIGISSIVFWNALTNIVLETKVDFVWKQTHFPLEVVTSADEQIL